MHMSPEFGLTYNEIEGDGVKISYKIDTLLSADSAEGVTKSIALGLISMADIFQHQQTDLLIVLGDRTELLSVCIAAMIKGIPIAHISGGETTEGAYDEAIRHAITKMSYLHFTATEDYRKRVIQLGETPDRVFNVGAIGVDSIKNLNLLSKTELEETLNFKFGLVNILVTFHSVTLEDNSSDEQFRELLKSLESFKTLTIIFTKPNSDKGSKAISNLIDQYVNDHPETAVSFNSLGQLRYLSTLQFVDMVVGNSSSGLVEVPYFKIPTINIGDRQKGRIMPDSVINCEPKAHEISSAIKMAMSDEFKDKVRNVESPYGDGNTAAKIFDIITRFKTNSVKKAFYDISK